MRVKILKKLRTASLNLGFTGSYTKNVIQHFYVKIITIQQ